MCFVDVGSIFNSELVELIGSSNKAPTASREEIEKSGLEVIKRKQLKQYERDNKIASNCIERVRARLPLLVLSTYTDRGTVFDMPGRLRGAR